MADEERRKQTDADLTGFRFHPTEEEIVSYFLAEKLSGHDNKVRTINEIDINKFEPWELPDYAVIPSDSVWYFFNKLDYMDPRRIRANRKTEAGYWKITGKDRLVKSKHGTEIGSKKTLVYHQGHFPNGVRTKWVIQEFHYKDANIKFERHFVLCRLKKKSGDGDEPSTTQLASNSGHCLNGDIIPQENHELPSDLQSFLVNDDPDNSSLSPVQFLMPTARPSRSINVLDVTRSQLDTRKQDDEFIDSILATGEDQHLHEENLQTRLHEFIKPVKLVGGYTESKLPVEQSSSSQSRSSRAGPRVIRLSQMSATGRASGALSVFCVLLWFSGSFGNWGRNKKAQEK